MTTPDALDRGEKAMSSAQPILSQKATQFETAITDFVSDLKGFKADLTNQLNQQESTIAMLNQKMTTPNRPPLSAAPLEAPHLKAFDAYVRLGEEDALRGLAFEGKSMSSAIAGDGGYLVDPVTSDTIKSSLANAASIRAIAEIVNVDATSYDVLVDHGDLGAGWANETAGTSESNTPTIDRISIALHELSALPKASQRLLDDSAFDIENWLAGKISTTFARSEAEAFVNGDGLEKPMGFLSHTTVENDNYEWGKIGHIITGEAGGLGDPDKLIELVYALEADYRANGTFVMNSKTAGEIRKLRDSDGRFLWNDGMASSDPARLLGYPVLIAEDMPDVEVNATPIAFGDFARGYTIAERPDLRVMRDPFSAKPNVLFYATKRVGGDVTDFAAIKLLKFAAQ
ncbi:phage major capsid protein, HK97 family [Nereida ignava]|uniref:Phage major capsid protein, HK97 family n=2 Tax=Nereida ignava TaxID=282199 RepID=A0A0U1NH90_9RHOB|nr:phage major capsid protein, HK97 family [Nereida ignava]SFJ27985.1 phage major capsid protein, HK97 family [Nereida ignava DSM 16309]